MPALNIYSPAIQVYDLHYNTDAGFKSSLSKVVQEKGQAWSMNSKAPRFASTTAYQSGTLGCLGQLRPPTHAADFVDRLHTLARATGSGTDLRESRRRCCSPNADTCGLQD